MVFSAVQQPPGDPAGGAALDQVVLATGSATLTLAGLWWLIARHRAGRAPRLERALAASERLSGLPGWAALPAGLSTAALLTALLGMYWDISLHIDNGRDAGPLALDGEDGDAEQGQDGAADQHQVGGAPEGDVLAEEAVPDVVEWEADQRERAAGADQDAAQRRPPVAGDPDRGRPGLLLGEGEREAAGGEDAVEADEDQVMGGVGERPGVAALVDVQGDVPVHAEQREEEGAAGDADGQGGPGGQPGHALGEGREAAKRVAR
ncbi:MAG: hypothetical protein ABW060_18550, partial [Solirubrobacteraceae bacterium]